MQRWRVIKTIATAPRFAEMLPLQRKNGVKRNASVRAANIQHRWGRRMTSIKSNEDMNSQRVDTAMGRVAWEQRNVVERRMTRPDLSFGGLPNGQ
jgi:hypothetical protein